MGSFVFLTVLSNLLHISLRHANSSAFFHICCHSLSQVLLTNRQNYEAYRRHLGHLKGVTMMAYDSQHVWNFQSVVAPHPHPHMCHPHVWSVFLFYIYNNQCCCVPRPRLVNVFALIGPSRDADFAGKRVWSSQPLPARGGRFRQI